MKNSVPITARLSWWVISYSFSASSEERHQYPIGLSIPSGWLCRTKYLVWLSQALVPIVWRLFEHDRDNTMGSIIFALSLSRVFISWLGNVSKVCTGLNKTSPMARRLHVQSLAQEAEYIGRPQKDRGSVVVVEHYNSRIASFVRRDISRRAGQMKWTRNFDVAWIPMAF